MTDASFEATETCAQKPPPCMPHCGLCGGDIIPKKMGRVPLYCSTKCQEKAKGERRKKARRKNFARRFREPRICLVCDAEFTPKFEGGQHRQYCSDACRIGERVEGRDLSQDEEEARLSRQRAILARLRGAFSTGVRNHG